jgi:CheY-like chemotaxis protein
LRGEIARHHQPAQALQVEREMHHIVVIDDEASIRRTLGAVLERAGYTVLVAADGREGLELCAAAAPDLVITDIQMPGVDGIETIAALRALYPLVPVIAISGGDRPDRLTLLERTASQGAVSALRKPFTIPELLDAIQGALRPDTGGGQP